MELMSWWQVVLMSVTVLIWGWSFGICFAPPSQAVKPLQVGEAVGPFSSWLNVKRDFGAQGDGKADDTDALQRALEAIRPSEAKAAVLFLPAGTYRITRTLRVARHAHAESQHILILGEHPDTTVIRWDGESDGVMIAYEAWYARMGRLTLDGAKKARTAILCAPHFATYNEFADMVFRDVAFGIEAGRMDTQGNAETTVARCRFLRCTQAGISIQNFNSLDWFIWHCVFEDCGLGVTNTFGAGNFHVYNSVFLRSQQADIAIGHAAYFSLRGNYSEGSRSFLTTWAIGASHFLTIERNTVLDPKEAAVQVRSVSPVLLMDNLFRTQKAPAVVIGENARLVSIGNTFTVKDAIQAPTTAICLDDRIVDPKNLKLSPPSLPKTLPLTKPFVVEVPTNAKALDIQRAIDEAAKRKGQKPVVHLPVGTFEIDRPLRFPAGCDVWLVGDGGKTVLRWVGEGNGPVLHFSGPSRVRLADLRIDGAQRADGILVAGCDQPRSRLIADQLNLSGNRIGLFVNRLRHIALSLLNINVGSSDVGVKVVGIGQPNQTAPVVIFSGASSNLSPAYELSNGGVLVVRDIWYEGSEPPPFAAVSGDSTFALHSVRVFVGSQQHGPVVELRDFRGRAAFVMADLNGGDRPKVVVRKGSTGAKVLLLGCGGNSDDDLLLVEEPRAQAILRDGFKILPGGGWQPVPDKGKLEPAFLNTMLAITRNCSVPSLPPVAEHVADWRWHRLLVDNCQVGVRMEP